MPPALSLVAIWVLECVKLPEAMKDARCLASSFGCHCARSDRCCRGIMKAAAAALVAGVTVSLEAFHDTQWSGRPCAYLEQFRNHADDRVKVDDDTVGIATN